MKKKKEVPSLTQIIDFITEVQKETRKEEKEKGKEKKDEAKKKRGRPYTYSDQVMTKVYFVMLSKGIKEFSTLWRYLKEHPEVRKSCGLKKLPNRSTFSRRMRNFSPSAGK
jgi:transposase